MAEIPKVQDRPVEIDSITNTNDLAEQSLPDLNKKKNKFIPIDEFAKKKLKENVLKNKTFSETIVEELAEATNQKISFESVKNDNGNTEQYALNIGKFSFSRKK